MKTIRAAQNLQKDGYEKQSVFGIVASNRLNLAPVVFAALSLGCVINPLDPSFGRTELIHMWKTVKPKVGTTDPSNQVKIINSFRLFLLPFVLFAFSFVCPMFLVGSFLRYWRIRIG